MNVGILGAGNIARKMAQTINGGNTVINVYPSSSMDINALAREIERRIIAAQNSRRLAWQ